MGIVDFNTCVWNKKWIRNLPPEGKLLFLYLWTNDHKNLIAMYEIDTDKIAFEIGITSKKVIDTLSILSPKVLYDHEKSIVWVVNHFRHQFMRTEKISPKIIEAAKKCLISMKGHFFVSEFINMHNTLILFNSEIPYPYPLKGYQYPPGGGVGKGEGEGEDSKGIIKGKRIKGFSPAKTLLPDNFSLTGRVVEWASKKNINSDILQKHLSFFISACKAKGYQYVDWDEAFMNAVRSDWAKLNQGCNNNNQSDEKRMELKAKLRNWYERKARKQAMLDYVKENNDPRLCEYQEDMKIIDFNINKISKQIQEE